MKTNKKSIKSWSEDERPREKLLKHGAEALSSSELIAILLGSGSISKSAVELAREILNSCNNNLNSLARKSIKDLMKFNGIGEAKAVTIVAALELGKRRKLEETKKQTKITSSKLAYEYFQPIMCDLNHEEFYIMFLNRGNFIIDIKKISQGGISETVIDVKILIKHALDFYAQGIIVAHNHPSGNLTPSDSDIRMTKKIKQASDLFDIHLLDHLIIANNDFYSFADNGQI